MESFEVRKDAQLAREVEFAIPREMTQAQGIELARDFAQAEFVWVLLRVYGLQQADAANAIRALLESANVEVNRPAVEAGLLVLDTGADFADGVIAYEGHWLGGETFVSFDKKTVALLAAQGQSVRLL